MPATPPPLPYAYVSRSGPPSRTNDTPTLFALSWSPIVASASVALALIVSVAAWIATHPHKVPRPREAATVAVVLPEIETPPPPPTVAVLAPMPAFHRARPAETTVDRLPLLEEEPPPLPPPPAPRPKPQPVVEVKPPPPVGETYGTQVLFLNNQAVAVDQARREHKLLFVMHISGNFEDSCFT